MISKVMRWPIYGAFVLFGVSLLVGRLMGPELGRRRLRNTSLGPVVCLQKDDRRDVVFLNGRRGELVSMPLPQGHRLDSAALSPWQDGLGQGEVAGLWVAISGEGNHRVRSGFGLARFRYPDGELLNRVTTDVLPGGPPCWTGALGDEIVFASGSGRLYRFAFSGSTDPRSTDGCDVEPTALGWDVPTPGAISDLTRPLATGCEGLYLASVRREHGGLGTKTGRSEIWWLQLDEMATRVIAAGPLTKPADEGKPDCDRYPALGRMVDGTPYLVTLRKERGRADWSLQAVEVGLSPGSTVPIETRGRVRTLVSECAGNPPSFGVDAGTIVYLASDRSSTFVVATARFEIMED